MDPSLVIFSIFGAIVLFALIFGFIYMFRIWNSPDGERYARTAAQGPFVPLGGESHDADEPDLQKRQGP